MKPPCKNCTDRVLGCHSRCQKYIDFRADMEKLYEIRRRNTSEKIYIYDACVRCGGIRKH